jgi:hypothetical protein
MKKLLFLLIAVLGVLMVASHVYAANQEDTLGATVKGSAIHTMSITSGSSLSIQDPGDKGPQTYTLTGGPVSLVINDNDVAAGSGTKVMVTGKITSELPAQYGNSGVKTYFLRYESCTWNPNADTDVTPLGTIDSANVTSTDEFGFFGAVDSNAGVVSGQIDMDWFLVVRTDRRVYGSTSDSITITYTYYDDFMP